jgi:adenosine deaminase
MEKERADMIDPTLPFIDLHRHLDGNVRLETILDLGRKHNLALPAWHIEGLRPHVQLVAGSEGPATTQGVMAFIAKFRWMTEVLVDYDACYRVAYENVEDARREGLDYVELRFSPWFMAETHSLDPAGVTEAVVDGVRGGARDHGQRVNLIGIISRTYGPEAGRQELEALLSQREQLVALDLAGDEANWPGELFLDHIRRARDAGWRITVHAGESDGPHSIWQALGQLGAERIGHGVAAAQDPALMAYMAEHRIGIETSLTSNVQTSTVESYAAHPARLFLERDMLVTLNTDDPGISGIDLRYEYEVAAPAAGLSPAQVQQAQRNSLAVAFVSDGEQAAILASKAALAT